MTTPRRSTALLQQQPPSFTKTPAPSAAASTSRSMRAGDQVFADVNGQRYVGILRHYGPVHFRTGTFAGIELVGECRGKGKNNGTVEGHAYFTCEPNDGIFCPSSRVKLRNASPAMASRPLSAMARRSVATVDSIRPRSSMAFASTSSAAHGLETPHRKVRASTGSSLNASLLKTPTNSNAAAGGKQRSVRSSLAAEMPPPPSSWKQSTGNANGAVRTPGHIRPPSRTLHVRATEDPTRSRSRTANSDENVFDDEEDATMRKRGLLEQMHLLTPLGAKGQLPPQEDSALFSGLDEKADVAEGLVPMSMYELANTEKEELKSQIAELKRTMETEIERAKAIAQAEALKEMEEEREVERRDDQRRRKEDREELLSEWTGKETAWKQEEKALREQVDSLQSEIRKAGEESEKAKAEHEKERDEKEIRLRDSEALVDKLKSAAEPDEAKKQAGELEANQLNERIRRLEDERSKLLKEIDELKAAGEEAMDILEREKAMHEQRVAEVEQNMRLLEAHAQEAIASAFQEGQQQAAQGGSETPAAAIEKKSLEEDLARLEKRCVSLEDDVNYKSVTLKEERETYTRNTAVYVKREAKLKADAVRWKARSEEVEQAQKDLARRIESLEYSLEESHATLERERNELESLRNEVLITGDTSSPDLSNGSGQRQSATSAPRQQLELNGLRVIVNQLHEDLAASKQRERDLREQLKDPQPQSLTQPIKQASENGMDKSPALSELDSPTLSVPTVSSATTTATTASQLPFRQSLSPSQKTDDKKPAPPSSACVECEEVGHSIDDCPYLNDDVLF